jgi:hypothetical protein
MRVDGRAPPVAGFETSVTFTDPMLQLQAEAMAEEQNQMLTDSAAEMKARAEKQEANAEAVEAMREQADAIRTGGIAQGGTLIVGSGMHYAGGKVHSELLSEGGSTVQQGGEPLKDIVGKAPATKAEADAAQARNLAEQKQWNVDDAKERRQRAEKQQDNAMNQLNQEMRAQRETTSFILQRMLRITPGRRGPAPVATPSRYGRRSHRATGVARPSGANLPSEAQSPFRGSRLPDARLAERTQPAPRPGRGAAMNPIAEAPTVEAPLFARSTVFEARDCRVEIVRERSGRVIAVIVVAREGVSVGRTEPSAREGAGAGRGR